jgi:phospholipid/cholesterol/gamma-HCH transport system permease protein
LTALLRPIESSFEYLFRTSGGVLLLLVQSLLAVRLRGTDLARLLRQCYVIGVQTLPLAALIGLFTGMIIALNIGLPLADFGQEARLGGFLGLGMVREFAPVFTAFIVAARVGAAMTAELGAMTVGDEVNALRSLGISPVRFLAAPRIVATILMNPMLTMFALATGLFGGLIVAETVLDVPASLYWRRVFDFVDFHEAWIGLLKTLIFGAIISGVCVYKGLTTTGGAEGVGSSTTRGVVISLTMILVADFIVFRALA